MNKEKIVFANGTELEYDSISAGTDALTIGIIGGNVADVESIFREAGQENLETIKQVDAEGNQQAVHKLYDIFYQITIYIDAIEVGEEKKNLVEVTLKKEGELEARIRQLEKLVAFGSGGTSEEVTTLKSRVDGVEKGMESIEKAILNGEVKE